MAERKKPKKKASLTEADIILILKDVYEKSGCVVIPKVPDATGYGKVRTADAIILSCWPSRGLSATGVEIKTSRSDLMRELQQPEKAESIARYMDMWILCVSNEKVYDGLEALIPKPWGIVIVGSGNTKIKTVREAEKMDADTWGRDFCCALVRQASQTVFPEADLKKMVEKAGNDGFQRGWDAGEKHGRESVERHSVADLRENVKKFEELSGIQITSYSDPTKLVAQLAQLTFIADSWHNPNAAIDRAMDRLREAKKELEESFGPFGDGEDK